MILRPIRTGLVHSRPPDRKTEQGFRISRALHRLITGQRRSRPAIAQASMEDIYRQQGRGRQMAGRGRRGAEALGWGQQPAFDGVDPWNSF